MADRTTEKFMRPKVRQIYYSLKDNSLKNSSTLGESEKHKAH